MGGHPGPVLLPGLPTLGPMLGVRPIGAAVLQPLLAHPLLGTLQPGIAVAGVRAVAVLHALRADLAGRRAAHMAAAQAALRN